MQKINNDIYRIYNPGKFSSTRRIECNPTILDGSILMSEDNDFMTKMKIEKECRCTKKDICKQIIDLLLHSKLEEAEALLANK